MKQVNCEKLLKKLVLALTLLIALLLTSCRTVKSTTQEQTSTTLNTQSIATEHVQTLDSTRTHDSITVHITDTYYTPPNSAGKQYIQHVAQSIIVHTATKQAAITTVSDKKNSSATQASQITQKKESIKQTTKTSSALNIIALIVGLGIVIIAILVLRRCGVLKW